LAISAAWAQPPPVLASPAEDNALARLCEVAECLAVSVEFEPNRSNLRELKSGQFNLPSKGRARVRRRDEPKFIEEGAAMKVDDGRAINEFDAPEKLFLIIKGREAPHVALAPSRTFEEFTERGAEWANRVRV
jgi:hypothetical protein